MANVPDVRLVQSIAEVVAKVRKFRDRGMGEQNTKASLIEPVVEALGWDIRDPDEVHREFRGVGKDSPVDYALKLRRESRLFLEAKGLGEDLTDRRWVAQVLGYAVVAGVRWCVLTDGDCYRFYNALAPVDADQKLLRCVQLSECDPAEAARTLSLISRRNMQDNIIETLWDAHFVDRRVKEALVAMFASADRSLVRLVHAKTVKLTPKLIADSLRRLDVKVDIPVIDHTAPVAVPPGPQGPPPPTGAVTLADLIRAGLLTPPVPLFRDYKGKRLEATLLVDGGVEFEGTRYASASTAAVAAVEATAGRRMATNGWNFWHFRDAAGNAKELVAVRGEYLATRPGGSTGSRGPRKTKRH